LIYVSVEEESVVFHNVLTQDHGQEFVVGDLLDVSGDDVSRFLLGKSILLYFFNFEYLLIKFESNLEESFVIPVRIDFAQLGRDPVVFSQENGVQGDQHDLLVDSAVASLEAVEIPTGPLAVVVGILGPGRQKFLEPQIAQGRVAVEPSAAEGAQLVRRVFGRSVDETGVQEAGDGVEGAARSQFAFVFQSGGRSDEFQATPSEQRVEGIIGRDVDGPAGRVASIGRHVAAFGLGVRPGI
jgi:hypothetical protein